MVALGPRVGGAHVDVNMKFDDNSIDRVGRKMHSQLEKLSDRSSANFRRQFDEAYGEMQVFVGKVITLLPLASSAISALSGGIVGLAANIANASKSALGFVGILTSLGVAAGTIAFAFNGIGEAIKAEAGEGLDAILAEMGPNTRDAVLGLRSVREELQNTRGVVQEALFRDLGDQFQNLSFMVLPTITHGLEDMGEALNGVLSGLLDYVQSGPGLTKISLFLQNNASIFEKLGKAFVPFLDGFLGLLNALAPSSERLADRLTDLAERFSDLTNAVGFDERIDNMMISAEASAGLFLGTLKNLGGAFRNIFAAALPEGDSFMQTLLDVTQRFQDWTGSVEGQNSIAEWVGGAVDSLKALGPLIVSVAKFFTALSDPSVIQGFTDVLTSAFETLNKFPLEELAEGLGKFLSFIAPAIGPIVAVAAGMASLRTITGTLTAVFGGVVSAGFKVSGLFTGLQTALGFLTGSSGAAGAASSLGSLSGVIGGLGANLGLILKGAGLVGLAIWIGTIIANSEELRAKVGEIFDKLKEVFSELVKAGEEIYESLKPIIEALTEVFIALTPVLEFLVGVILENFLNILDALIPTIQGVASIISGFIDILVGLFTFDGELILGGLKKLVSGVGKIALGFFKSMTALPRALFTSIRDALSGMKDRLGAAGPALGRLAGDLVSSIVDVLKRLPGLVLNIVVDLVTNVATGIYDMSVEVIATMVQFAIDFIQTIIELPGQLLAIGKDLLVQLLAGIVGELSSIHTAVTDLVNDIKDFFIDLPGDLLEIGKDIIKGLLNGMKEAALLVPNFLGGLASDIVGFFPGSPVKQGPLTAWNHGGDASGGGRNLINAIATGLEDTTPIDNALTSLTGRLASVGAGGGAGGGAGSTTNNREMSVVINNPVPERSAESLTTASRNLAYLGM